MGDRSAVHSIDWFIDFIPFPSFFLQSQVPNASAADLQEFHKMLVQFKKVLEAVSATLQRLRHQEQQREALLKTLTAIQKRLSNVMGQNPQFQRGLRDSKWKICFKK